MISLTSRNQINAELRLVFPALLALQERWDNGERTEEVFNQFVALSQRRDALFERKNEPFYEFWNVRS